MFEMEIGARGFITIEEMNDNSREEKKGVTAPSIDVTALKEGAVLTLERKQGEEGVLLDLNCGRDCVRRVELRWI